MTTYTLLLYTHHTPQIISFCQTAPQQPTFTTIHSRSQESTYEAAMSTEDLSSSMDLLGFIGTSTLPLRPASKKGLQRPPTCATNQHYTAKVPQQVDLTGFPNYTPQPVSDTKPNGKRYKPKLTQDSIDIGDQINADFQANINAMWSYIERRRDCGVPQIPSHFRPIRNWQDRSRDREARQRASWTSTAIRASSRARSI